METAVEIMWRAVAVGTWGGLMLGRGGGRLLWRAVLVGSCLRHTQPAPPLMLWLQAGDSRQAQRDWMLSSIVDIWTGFSTQ